MDFKFYDFTSLGKLNPDDLSFFYYDVACLSELENVVEASNENLIVIAKECGIKLVPIKQITFSSNKLTHNENEIYFTILKEYGKDKIKVELSYQTALLKHLRNSFAHYRISYIKEGTLISIEDKVGKKHTLKGVVDIKNLRDFIFSLRKYHENYINEYANK